MQGENSNGVDRPGVRRLVRLLAPRSIAVVGGSVAAEVIRQCRKIGFQGNLWAVNPSCDSIEGVRTHASVEALPQAPDAAFIAVRREASVDVVAALAAHGAGGAVCYASGFAEIGGDGVALQARLVEAAGAMALLGPNCYGVLNFLDGCALWPDHFGGQRVTRGVAIITQSGNLALNLTLQAHHLPIAYMMAIGNKAVSDIHDCIDAVALDPRVSAIGIHLEGLTSVAEFSRAVRRAQLRGVPVVVLKTGRSAIAAELAASHTRSLAGSDVLYDALFERESIARVENLSEFLETLKLLHVHGPGNGTRVAALCCSGGDAALLADEGEAAGIEFPSIDPDTGRRLAAVLGPHVALNNPLDYQTYIWGNEELLTRCFADMLTLDADVALLVLDFPPATGPTLEGWDQVVNAFIAASAGHGRRAILVSSMAELMPKHIADRLLAVGIAPMQGLPEVVRAIAARNRALRPAGGASLPDAPVLTQGASVLREEHVAKRMLAAAGVPIPRHEEVCGAESAVQAARAIGYPVVLKALGDGLAHKTELGAVKLDLRDDDAVATAAASLEPRFKRLLVEQMVTGAIAELIVGVTRDPQFGLALTIGAGGVLVELLADARTLLLPVGSEEIESALRSLRAFALLDGYRGRPRVDLAPVVEAILAVARFALHHQHELVELDVNPLIVTERQVFAVDALLRLSESNASDST